MPLISSKLFGNLELQSPRSDFPVFSSSTHRCAPLDIAPLSAL